MSFATFVRNRNAERFVALLSAVAVLMSLMAIYAQPAQAHNGTVSWDCDGWSIDLANYGAGADITITIDGQVVDTEQGWVSYSNSGRWSDKGPHSFDVVVDADDDNDQPVHTFTSNGSFSPDWQNGEWSFTLDVETADCFNPSCPSEYLEYKLEPVSSSGAYGPNDEFTIDLGSSTGGQVFDWTSTVPVFQVIVKGGPGANIYDYSGAFEDEGLHAPVNPNNGQYYGLSHISFCYQESQDEPVEVQVTGGVCLVDAQGLPAGSASVTIDPVSGATVEIFSDAAMNDLVATVTSSDGVEGLSPGTYYWSASAADGYQLSGDDTGQFTIDDCDASVTVAAGACQVDQQGQPVGSLDVTIDPASGATVDVYSDAALTDLVASVSSSDTVSDLEPGTYYWEASAGSGFTIDGASQGQVTIDDCEASVTVTANACTVDQQGQPVGGVTVTIDPASSAIVEIYSDAAMTDQVATVTSSGSADLAPGTYYWDADENEGFDLTGDTEGQFTVGECDVTVAVSPGVCEVGQQGQPAGEVEVVIDPDSGAVVEIFSDDALTALVATVSSSGSVSLAPGTYYWAAASADGFDISGDDTASFTIDPCDVSIDVVGACIVLDGAGVGQIDVTLSSPGAANVEITDSSATVVATLTDTGTVTVPVGDSYSWTATPATGFDVIGETSGEFQISDCTPPPPPPEQGEIIVQKVVIGGATEAFEFTFDTTGFDLADDTLGHGQQSSSGPLEPGDGYAVSEVVPAGWRLVSASCDDGSDPSNIDLAANEQVTCTFTNTIDDQVQAAIEVTVEGSCETEDGDGVGLIEITVSVEDGATVVVRDSDGDVVGTVTSEGTIDVPEGATYTWVATPAEGFEFPPGAASSGSLTIESCSNPETLPFTGIDSHQLGLYAMVLLGAGITTVFLAPRRRED